MAHFDPLRHNNFAKKFLFTPKLHKLLDPIRYACSWRKLDVSEVDKVLAVAKNVIKARLRHLPTDMT